MIWATSFGFSHVSQELQKGNWKGRLPAHQFADVLLLVGNELIVKQPHMGQQGRALVLPRERAEWQTSNQTWSFPTQGAELWGAGSHLIPVTAQTHRCLLDLSFFLSIGKTGNEKDKQQKSCTQKSLFQPPPTLAPQLFSNPTAKLVLKHFLLLQFPNKYSWTGVNGTKTPPFRPMMCLSVCLDMMRIAAMCNCPVQITLVGRFVN